jgi:hypothetical protein
MSHWRGRTQDRSADDLLVMLAEIDHHEQE